MRIGLNPNKDKVLIKNDFFHQIIIPVYIPNQLEYFRDSLQILKFCLESLFKTCHNRTFFTVVNNGSCQEVLNFINELYQDNKIHEIIHTTNIGKLNAILKAAVGHNFQLITITDADVMFLNNWQSETYAVFNNFEKAGVVSPTPSPKIYKYLTYNVICSNLFSNKLTFTKTKNPNALVKFADSIESPNFYNKYHLEKNLTLESKSKIAVVGAGHFVATYRGTIFDKIDVKYSKFGLGGNSENEILDEPVVNQGLWRLSTEDNFAYHLGNVVEPWMFEVIEKIEDKQNEAIEEIQNVVINNNNVKLFLGTIFFKKIVNQTFFWKWFLKYKGLNKIEVQEY